MGGLPLPKFKRCCFCTRKLKVACILIAFWSMLTTCHSVRILFHPICYELYSEMGGHYYEEIAIVKWILFSFDMLTLLSSFIFILGLFMGYTFTADIFMAAGFLTAITMLVHAAYSLLQLFDSDCTNPSDIIAHILYSFLWFYFILIVNSHRDNMKTK